MRGGDKIVETDYAIEDKFEHLPQPDARRRSSAAASPPSSPCRKAATSSAPSASVPYTRGSEVSRPVAQIVAEAERLAEAGVREVDAARPERQCLARRGRRRRANGALAGCCSALAEIPGLARLRYTTSHPRDMDDELIAAHRDLPALMPYLHLPVQSGSDRILKAMNRRHTRRRII